MKRKITKKTVGCLALSAVLMGAPIAGAIAGVGPVIAYADEVSSVSDNSDNESDVKPNVSITITAPEGWQKDSAKVSIGVEDLLNTGNFSIAKVEAKIGQSSGWQDVTEAMCIDVSENCSVYVQVTDQHGNIYSKNKGIKCFDKTKPTLNSAVNNGLLTVEAYDGESGVAVVYVNGYEFTELTNGTLNIRLKKFDKGYEYFTIRAMDNSGNMSDTYKIKNPYYESEEDKKNNNGSPSTIALPTSVTPTAPSTATANVTEHVVTNSVGDEISFEEQKKAEMSKADEDTTKATTSEDSYKRAENGKEFYTITTESEKVFYLVIDRDGEEEKVYFLTEINENDLLNVTEKETEELPANSAALESAIKSHENEGAEDEESETVFTPSDEVESEDDIEEVETKKENNAGVYVVMGAVATLAIGVWYFLKKKKKNEEDFLDEDDEEDEEEIYESDEEESDDFFKESDEAPEVDVTETIDDSEESED